MKRLQTTLIFIVVCVLYLDYFDDFVGVGHLDSAVIYWLIRIFPNLWELGVEVMDFRESIGVTVRRENALAVDFRPLSV